MVERKKIFDSHGFYKALDSTRVSRGLNWKQVGAASSVNTSTLTRLSQNKNPDADGLAALAAWAGLNPADFVKGVQKATHAETLAAISQFIRNDANLDAEGANALDEIVRAAYQQFADRASRKGPAT